MLMLLFLFIWGLKLTFYSNVFYFSSTGTIWVRTDGNCRRSACHFEGNAAVRHSLMKMKHKTNVSSISCQGNLSDKHRVAYITSLRMRTLRKTRQSLHRSDIIVFLPTWLLFCGYFRCLQIILWTRLVV